MSCYVTRDQELKIIRMQNGKKVELVSSIKIDYEKIVKPK